VNLTSLKSLHYGTQRRVLCAVLATLIALCAVMVALPGLYQVLFNQTQAVSNCHFHLSESSVADPEVTGHSKISNTSSHGDTTGSTHQGSSTVCSGEFVNTEGVNTFASLSDLLFAVLFYAALSQASRPSPVQWTIALAPWAAPHPRLILFLVFFDRWTNAFILSEVARLRHLETQDLNHCYLYPIQLSVRKSLLFQAF